MNDSGLRPEYYAGTGEYKVQGGALWVSTE